MKRGRHAFTWIALLAGLALFAYLVKQAGVWEIIARIRALGPGLAIIILLSALRTWARALAWFQCMTTEERQVGRWAVWRARVIGDAAGHLTTAGPIIAEPVRIHALGSRLSVTARVLSLAVETLTYAFSSCVMVLAGALALLAAFALSQPLRAASWLALAAMLWLLVIAAIVVIRRWALLSILGEMARRTLHLVGFSRRWKRKVAHLRMLENHVFDFYAQRPADFLIVALCEALFHLAGVAEVWVSLYLLDYTPTLLAAFTLEATNRMINMLFSFIPARIGVDEAGTGLLAETLGFGVAAGVMLAIIRKARVLFWTGVGLLLFIASRSRKLHHAGEAQ
jgi:hypothetical protein